MKRNTSQFMKYFLAAGVGYIVDFGAMVLCKEIFQLHYLVSATIGFIVGLVVVYIVSSRYVFGESKIKSRRHEFVLFALIGLVGLGILNLVMWILTSGISIDYMVSKILATVAVYMWNFLARRALYYN